MVHLILYECVFQMRCLTYFPLLISDIYFGFSLVVFIDHAYLLKIFWKESNWDIVSMCIYSRGSEKLKPV